MHWCVFPVLVVELKIYNWISKMVILKDRRLPENHHKKSYAKWRSGMCRDVHMARGRVTEWREEISTSRRLLFPVEKNDARFEARLLGRETSRKSVSLLIARYSASLESCWRRDRWPDVMWTDSRCINRPRTENIRPSRLTSSVEVPAEVTRRVSSVTN